VPLSRRTRPTFKSIWAYFGRFEDRTERIWLPSLKARQSPSFSTASYLCVLAQYTTFCSDFSPNSPALLSGSLSRAGRNCAQSRQILPMEVIFTTITLVPIAPFSQHQKFRPRSFVNRLMERALDRRQHLLHVRLALERRALKLSFQLHGIGMDCPEVAQRKVNRSSGVDREEGRSRPVDFFRAPCWDCAPEDPNPTGGKRPLPSAESWCIRFHAGNWIPGPGT
jgi:hypothetical protein